MTGCQRLKQAGMHWTTVGADAIIALRCREASSKWEAICNMPRSGPAVSGRR
jgi:hypothetical protein